MNTAVNQVQNFEADFGGTEIYSPLKDIFGRTKPIDCAETHVFLLTDGAVSNTQGVIDLV